MLNNIWEKHLLMIIQWLKVGEKVGGKIHA